jgi:hypothetical protein
VTTSARARRINNECRPVSAPTHRLYRRSATVVLWWRDGQAIACDYALNIQRPLPAEHAHVLHDLNGWITVADLSRPQRRDEASVGTMLEELAAWGFVERSCDAADDTRARLDSITSGWSSW